MLRRFTVGGIAALVTIVAATMVASVSPTEAATFKEKTGKNCTRICEWKCSGVGAFGRCVGQWVKRCGEATCFRQTE
jgi:hypothetical protein